MDSLQFIQLFSTMLTIMVDAPLIERKINCDIIIQIKEVIFLNDEGKRLGT